ncbi:MAG: phage portal protein [Anaerolineae bacterium]|nr:phage portal protein [Anaerolineae bacterium]
MKVATRNGRTVNAHILDGGQVKDIPFSAITQYDLERWFGGKTSNDPAQLYARVVTLFRCVELRAYKLAAMPRQIENIESGEVVAVANFPSPVFDDKGMPLTEELLPFSIDLDDLLIRSEMAQSLLAEAYWHVLRNRVKVTEVRWLDPRTVSPNYAMYKGLVSFSRVVNGRSSTIPVEDMAYVWRPGLQETGPGVAPAQAAARDAGIDDHMKEFIEIFFEKGAMPTTLFFSETRPDEPERGRIKKYLEQMMSGIGNAFGIEVLNTALKFEQLTPPLKELIIPDISDRAQNGIIVGLVGGARSAILGGSANFATAEVEDISFYDKILIPEVTMMFKRLNRTFFNGQGLRLRARPDLLEVFQRQEGKKVIDATRLFDRGAIDTDELREAAGYQPRTKQEKEAALQEIRELEEATTVAPPSTNGDTRSSSIRIAPMPRQQNAIAEVKQWERKVLKRLPTERPYTIPFTPEHLTAEERP